MKIAITQKELNDAYKKHYKSEGIGVEITGMCDITEDLGECLGTGGIQEEYWYFEAVDETVNYVRKSYDFEADILKMNDAQYSALCSRLNTQEGGKDGVHTHSAAVALNEPEVFEEVIEECRTQGSYELEGVFPSYDKEVSEARAYTEKEMRRDFVRGDYRGNFEGVETLLAKYLGAEDATVEGYEAVTIEYTDDGLLDLLEDHGYNRDKRLTKRYTLESLVEGAIGYKEKKREESARRKAEREKTEAYQKAQREADEAARRAKINAIRA